MDISSCAIKLDHSVGVPEPLPNWRQVPGFPVYGGGQPTMEGLTKVKEKLGKEKVLWFNLRCEPVCYLEGLPVALRNQDALHTNIQVSIADAEQMEEKMLKEISSRAKDNSVEIHKDKGLADNPMDRVDEVLASSTEGSCGFLQILTGLGAGEEPALPGLKIVRVPFDEQRAIPEECFDLIAKSLCGESAATTQCVFSSQLGQGRSTLGMVTASIVKAMQMINKLYKMVDAGMADKAWAANIIKSKFEDPLPSEDLKDHFMRGEWDVIMELIEKLPGAKAGKVLADKMIDICGTPPEGTGMQNLRKAIIQMKYKYDASTEDKQYVWKNLIVNFIERYFYIICFATYARDHEASGFSKSFKTWMDEHKELREMIANGKDKLEWTRKVDQSAVEKLRDAIQGPDYKEKLGGIVSQLYKLAFQTYHDIPRGPIKDNLMRKLACKTLMEILPSEVGTKISEEIKEKKLSVDFDTVVGLVVG